VHRRDSYLPQLPSAPHLHHPPTTFRIRFEPAALFGLLLLSVSVATAEAVLAIQPPTSVRHTPAREHTHEILHARTHARTHTHARSRERACARTFSALMKPQPASQRRDSINLRSTEIPPPLPAPVHRLLPTGGCTVDSPPVPVLGVLPDLRPCAAPACSRLRGRCGGLGRGGRGGGRVATGRGVPGWGGARDSGPQDRIVLRLGAKKRSPLSLSLSLSLPFSLSPSLPFSFPPSLPSLPLSPLSLFLPPPDRASYLYPRPQS
jgi:hypothetical protein